jgi:hypothetical protein
LRVYQLPDFQITPGHGADEPSWMNSNHWEKLQKPAGLQAVYPQELCQGIVFHKIFIYQSLVLEGQIVVWQIKYNFVIIILIQNT